jgi:hypothetical protein
MGSKKVAERFLQNAKHDLVTTLRYERLSMLREPGEFKGALTGDMISPRFCIPPEYKVILKSRGRIYHISLYQQQEEEWVEIPLKYRKTDTKLSDDIPIPECLYDIKNSLRFAVIAIANRDCLHQTLPIFTKTDDCLEHEVDIHFLPIDSEGNTAKKEDVGDELQILGINSNKRTICLLNHIKSSTIDKLIPKAILQLIGAEPTTFLLPSEGKASPEFLPETFKELNEMQQSIANVWKLKTANEVAGPPGTGKTKTITELTRALLACTTFDIIVLSERNGAIDAIAEKYAKGCLSRQNLESKFEIYDRNLWESILTFGSPSMGSSTKLFTLSCKAE